MMKQGWLRVSGARWLPGVLSVILLLGGSTAGAQGDIPGSAAGMMGTIPGTGMSRDEFRARAYVQLATVALNAHAYFLVQNDFPPSYYDLFNSDAWNLDVTNIFTGRAVNAIEFTPGPKDLTREAPLPIAVTPNGTDAAAGPPPDLHTLTGPGGELEHGVQIDTDQLTAAAQHASKSNTERVDPRVINPRPAGDIYYYARNGLLQLVMFAPDGTYAEFVSQVPNRGWLDLLTIRAEGHSFPADVYANEVLFYMERQLPRHYNLVRFMGNAEPLTEAQLKNSGPQERLKMARELGVTPFNPYTKRAAKITAQPTPGELYLADKTKPVPIKMVLKSGEVTSFDQLTHGPGTPQQAPVVRPAQPLPGAAPGKPHKAPPLGGRKT